MSHPHPELGAPPKLPKGGLRVTPLGGLGEIGRNMTVFEYNGRLLIVDCGVLFPEEEQPGIDLILPDFTTIRDRLDDIEGIVLTHGHEDHIGGVPFLLRLKPDIPLIGSKLTLALIEAKLQEHRIRPYTLEVTEGHRERIGPFDCEFVAVNHSIPDALAVAIRTPAGMVVHTGDFKMDQLPLDRRLTDLPTFARLGEEGIDLLLSDSTNAEVPGFVPPERDISNVLRQVFGSAQKRIIVASFASHVHRIQQILDAAHEYGRRVAFVGRSMVRNMGIARDLGYLKVPAGLVVDVKTLDDLPDSEVVLVCTGSQGEPMAALTHGQPRPPDPDRPRRHGDPRVVPHPGQRERGLPRDQRPDPLGRERRPQGQCQGPCLGPRLGRRAPVLLQHLQAEEPHAGARRMAPPARQRRTRRADRGPQGPHRHRRGRSGRRPGRRQGQNRRQGTGGLRVRRRALGRRRDRDLLKDRRILGDEGIISVFLVVDSTTGKVVGGPHIQARGSGIEDSAFAAVIPKIEEIIGKSASDGVAEPHQLQQLVRRSVGKWVSDTYRRRPMILPVVVEV